MDLENRINEIDADFQETKDELKEYQRIKRQKETLITEELVQLRDILLNR